MTSTSRRTNREIVESMDPDTLRAALRWALENGVAGQVVQQVRHDPADEGYVCFTVHNGSYDEIDPPEDLDEALEAFVRYYEL